MDMRAINQGGCGMTCRVIERRVEEAWEQEEGGGEAVGREGAHESPIPSRKLTNVGHDDNDYGFLPLKNNNQPTMLCRADEACNREVG